MKFQPKTDWKYNDTPTEGDFNRIEQGIADALEGNDPIIQQDTPPEGVKEGRLWLDTSDDAYQGTVFETLKSEIDGHLADGTKHLTQNDRNKIDGALQRTGDIMTGKLDLNYERTRISKFDSANNHFLNYSDDDSDAIMNIHRGGIRDYTLNLCSKGVINEVLHAGNLGSLGVLKSATGGYVGDETDRRRIAVGFTPKFIQVTQITNASTDPQAGAVATSTMYKRGYSITSGYGYSSSPYGGGLNGIEDNGFVVSRSGGTSLNQSGYSYEWFALG